MLVCFSLPRPYTHPNSHPNEVPLPAEICCLCLRLWIHNIPSCQWVIQVHNYDLHLLIIIFSRRGCYQNNLIVSRNVVIEKASRKKENETFRLEYKLISLFIFSSGYFFYNVSFSSQSFSSWNCHDDASLSGVSSRDDDEA